MNFKTYFYEGIIKVPTEYVMQYVNQHIEELINKIKETLKTGYENYIEDNLIINDIEIPIIIQQDINPKNSYLSAQNDNIYLSAKNLKSLIKNKLQFISFLNNAIIHEITHLLDKGLKHKPQYTGNDKSEYINSPREFVAFQNMHINTIKNNINKDISYKEKVIDSFRKGSNFPDNTIDEFIKMLNLKNKIKFTNNVLNNI